MYLTDRVRKHGVELTEENKKQFYISEGFAHGFLVLSDTAEFCYKCTDLQYVMGRMKQR